MEARLREVEHRLEAAGFAKAALDRQPRWLEPEHRERQSKLASTLRDLGPLYALLGRYLATRLDRVPGDLSRALAALRDSDRPLGEGAVDALLRAELGEDGRAALSGLEAVPRASRGLFQVHRGRLRDGSVVSVKLLRTAVADGADRALLPNLAPYLSGLGWSLAGAERLLADYDATLSRACDLRREAASLESLARLPHAGDRFRVCRVVRPLTTSRVLTVEPPAGQLLDWEPRPPLGEAGAARRAADLWLELAVGGVIVEETAADELRRSAGGGLQLLGGLFREVPAEQAKRLLDYLAAASREDADACFFALCALCEEGTEACPPALRQQLGHAVPRRDGAFGPAHAGLPDLLLAHWLELERNDLRPRPPLLSFYRGLVGLRRQVGPALSEGVFYESLQVVRVSGGTRRLGEALDPALVRDGAGRLVAMLADLPGRLERSGWLDRRPPSGESQARAEPRRGHPAWVGGSLALLAVTAVLWAHRLPAAGGWGDSLEALVILAAGGVLLWSAWRG